MVYWQKIKNMLLLIFYRSICDFLFIYMKLKNLEKKTGQLHFKLHMHKKENTRGHSI